MDAPSGSAAGRSILFTTGTISRPFSIARYALASVCASIPWAASTTRSAPSHAWSERDTSYVKSTWPGVSMRLSSCPFHETRTACALIVMPRSRSRSIESRSCARISRAETASVTSRMRSASVDLPWSMCAMIEKLRMRPWSIPSAMVLRAVVRGRGGSCGAYTAPPPRVGSLPLRPRGRRYRSNRVRSVAVSSQPSVVAVAGPTSSAGPAGSCRGGGYAFQPYSSWVSSSRQKFGSG